LSPPLVIRAGSLGASSGASALVALLGLASAKGKGADGNDDEEDDVLHGVVVFWFG
jgi:hypothetical protein